MKAPRLLQLEFSLPQDWGDDDVEDFAETVDALHTVAVWSPALFLACAALVRGLEALRGQPAEA